MKRRNKILTVICTFLLFFLGSEFVYAQSEAAEEHRHTFGLGHPRTTQDLPPGQLRKNLESLPPKARGKALGWLQGFSFPAEDVGYLRASADGSIFYADTFLPDVENADVITGEAETITEAVSASQVFRLHSRPGASNVVFLDFDGHAIEGTAWNTDGNVLVALPYDPSQNDSPATVANFTQLEIDRIAIIWHRVSEDYAAFDIDVTTEEPAVFTPTTGRVLLYPRQ